MRRAILSTLDHLTGKSHDYCSVGGWCWFKNADKEECVVDLTIHYFPLLLPIYTDLTRVSLLERCLNTMTQNANESLNAEIWRRSPKASWCSLHSVYVGTCMAVINFNAGAKEGCRIQRHLGLKIGSSSSNYAAKKDEVRQDVNWVSRVKEYKEIKPADLVRQQGKVRKLAHDVQVRSQKAADKAQKAADKTQKAADKAQKVKTGRAPSVGRGRCRGRGKKPDYDAYVPGGI